MSLSVEDLKSLYNFVVLLETQSQSNNAEIERLKKELEDIRKPVVKQGD